MNPETSPLVNDLINFLDQSVCNFLAVDTISRRLNDAGFTALSASDHWDLKPGGRYYITKNQSALIAFKVGRGDAASGYKIISSHCDSPGFRVKPSPEIYSPGQVLKLNTEVYGGPILYTWFDRPLSLAGRVVSRGDSPLSPKVTVTRFDRPLLTIPHLAIHFNRNVNDGNPLSRQKDMLPVLAHIDNQLDANGFLLDMVARHTGIPANDILDFDLSLYDTTGATLFGANNEFISSGRLDDLSMVHASLTAMLQSTTESTMTNIMAVFDNEETGSGTKQGAASPLLADLLTRINGALGGDYESLSRAIDRSFMISADNAHAVHPNYAEKHDPTNHPRLGGGPVIKINANCKYMTDAQSSAVFQTICQEADVPCQMFVNHSDSAGGSTLGNILTSQIAIKGVDMGAAIWAMHSARETGSAADHIYTTKAFTRFYDL